MALELCHLIEKIAHKDITLLGGDKGMHNFVSWVHMVESLEASSFLEGGEIAFTTGIGLNSNLSILDLVQILYENRVAAVVINTGPFIESIPPEVVRFADEHDFPVFSVPWKIHVAEMIQIICYAITKSDQKDLETAAGFKNAIFFPKQEELYVVPLSQLGFQVNWSYSVCALKVVSGALKVVSGAQSVVSGAQSVVSGAQSVVSGAQSVISGAQPVVSGAQSVVSFNRLEEIRTDLHDFLRHRRHESYAVFHNENQVVIVLGNYDRLMLEKFVCELREYASGHLRKNEDCFFGIGKTTRSIRCLNKSYAQALSIQRLQEQRKIESDRVTYANLGIYKLLLGIEDRDILVEYYNSTLQPLLEYDEVNRADLAPVLHTYLLHDGSVKAAADALFLHRNTVNYKIAKAAEILGMDLSSLDSRLQLLLSFMLHDMLS